MHRREVAAPLFRMDGWLRRGLERLLPFVTALAIVYRTVVVLNPDFECPVLTESPLRTSLDEINVVFIWVLLSALFLSALQRMRSVVSELGVGRLFVWMLVQNLLTLSPVVLTYDVWLIGFIYATWAKKFLAFFQALYVFPVLALLAHSVFQHCFISTVRRSLCPRTPQNVNLGRVAELNVAINAMMLLHLVCIFVSAYRTRPHELADASWLMLLELIFRVVGAAAFLHIRHQQRKRPVNETALETDYDDCNTSLVYQMPPTSSLVKEEARRNVLGLDLAPPPPHAEEYQFLPQQATDRSNDAGRFVVAKNLSFSHASHPLRSLPVL